MYEYPYCMFSMDRQANDSLVYEFVIKSDCLNNRLTLLGHHSNVVADVVWYDN